MMPRGTQTLGPRPNHTSVLSVDADSLAALKTAQRTDTKKLDFEIQTLEKAISELDDGLEKAERTRRARILRHRFADSTRELQEDIAKASRTAETALSQSWSLSAIRTRTLAQSKAPAERMAFLRGLSVAGLESAANEAARTRDPVAGAAVFEELQRRQDRKEVVPEVGNHLASLVGNLLDAGEMATRDQLADVIGAGIDTALSIEGALTGREPDPVRRIQAFRRKEALSGTQGPYQGTPGDPHRHDRNTSFDIDW